MSRKTPTLTLTVVQHKQGNDQIAPRATQTVEVTGGDRLEVNDDGGLLITLHFGSTPTRRRRRRR